MHQRKFIYIALEQQAAVTLGWQDGCTSNMTYKLSKLGQTGLVFLIFRSEFISRFVRAGLQVFTCSGHDVCYPG